MDQHPEFTVGVFDYRLTTEHVETEAVADEIVKAGLSAGDVHVFAPPFGMHDFEGLGPTLEALGMDRSLAGWSEAHYRAGKVLIVVRPRLRRSQVEEILDRQGALEVRTSQRAGVRQ